MWGAMTLPGSLDSVVGSKVRRVAGAEAFSTAASRKVSLSAYVCIHACIRVCIYVYT